MLAVTNDPSATRKRGPLKPLNEVQLFELLKLHESLAGVAAFFGCSEDTIYRWCLKDFDMTFAELAAFHRADTKNALKSKAVALAKSGDKDMLKLLLKNWTDIKDNQSMEISETKHVKVTVELLKEAISKDPMIDVTPQALEIEDGEE